MKKSILLTAVLIITFSAFSQGTGDVVKAVFVDEFNVKWFGTDQGLLRFDGISWEAYNTRNKYAGEVSSIVRQESDEGSEIWVGTENGIAAATYTIDGISTATRYAMSNTPMESNIIVDIVLDTSDTRYFATPIGLGVFEVDQWNWLGLGWGPPESGVPLYELLSLGNKNDTVYIGSIQRGVGRIINEVDGFTGPSYYEYQYSGLIGERVNCIFTDSNGYQWFGTTEGISQHLTQDSKKGWDLNLTTGDGLLSNTVNAIFEDSNGDFWFATDEGASKYVYNSGVFTSYTTANGLANNQVFDIAEDQDKLLWFATANGVSSYDGAEFTNFSTGEQAKDFINIIDTPVGLSTKIHSSPLDVYPNPATSDVYIHYSKERDAYMDVVVYDLSGKKIRSLFYGYAGGGDLKVRWDLNDQSAKKVPGGIYFITITKDNEYFTKKLVVL